MPLKEVIEEITNQANEEAKQAVKQGENEAREITKKAELEFEQKTNEAKTNAAKAAEEMKKKKIAGTKLDLKKQLMQEKKLVLEQIVEGAKGKLGEMSEKQREDIIKKLIATAKEELSEVKFIECSEADLAIVKKHMPSAEVKNTLTGLGGIIAANKDKTIQVDLTLERLLESTKEEHIDEISKRIFK